MNEIRKGTKTISSIVAYIPPVSLIEYVYLSSSFQRLRKVSLCTELFKYKVFISTVGLDVCLEYGLSKKLQILTVM
jgi:hypothetical protein